jgi:hypothetical protein
MNRLLTINTNRFHRQSEKGTIHMNTQRIFKLFLLLALLALSSGIAQAQWGRKWDLLNGLPTPRDEAQSTDLLPSANNPTAQEPNQGGIFDVLERQKKAIVGSWLITDTTQGQPPLKGLASFTSDGIYQSSEQGDVKLDPNGVIASVAYGSWAHNGGRQFLVTLLQLGSAATGELIGTLKVQITITLSETGDEWSGSYRFTIFDPHGNVLASGPGTIQAQRIKVEPVK